MALVAFACTASAHCGSCGEGEAEKPKTECKCAEKCSGADCKCGCHAKKDENATEKPEKKEGA